MQNSDEVVWVLTQHEGLMEYNLQVSCTGPMSFEEYVAALKLWVDDKLYEKAEVMDCKGLG